MSQNTRNKPGEQSNSGRTSGQQRERQQYDGFEGMNFEQRRQPFHNRQQSDRDRDSRQGSPDQAQHQP